MVFENPWNMPKHLIFTSRLKTQALGDNASFCIVWRGLGLGVWISDSFGLWVMHDAPGVTSDLWLVKVFLVEL